MRPHATTRRTAPYLLLAVVCAALVAPSAHAVGDQPRKPVKKATTTCTDPGETAEFGAALTRLKMRKDVIPRDEFYVVVPVDVETGLDAGERTTIESEQKRARVLVPADGTRTTPAVRIELRLGGDVLQRVRVPAGCGVVDPTPDAGPVLGTITTAPGTVTVPVTNAGSASDEIGVTLFPVGGNAGDSRFLVLEPGATGSVVFVDVPAGEYTVEAFGYTSLEQVESAPFLVPGQE